MPHERKLFDYISVSLTRVLGRELASVAGFKDETACPRYQGFHSFKNNESGRWAQAERSPLITNAPLIS